MNSIEEFKSGDVISFYNRRNGSEIEEIRNCFEDINQSQVQELKIGDAIWVDEEPHYLKRKTRQYTYRVIRKIIIENRSYRIFFEEEIGFTTWPGCYDIAVAIDEKYLLQLIQENPKIIFSR